MDDWHFPFWIAHRGGGRLAPENTLAAFRTGRARGFRAFETDVKLSADGLPFLLHDATLDRTTDGRGDAGSLPWSELVRLDAGGEPLPTLEALAHWGRAEGVFFDLEIKPSPGRSAETGDAVARHAARLWSGDAAHAPMMSSFDRVALRSARDADPHARLMLLVDTLDDTGWYESAQALRCTAVMTNFLIMDAALQARIQAAGMRALVYTVNEPADAQRLRAQGIDGICTDALDVFKP